VNPDVIGHVVGMVSSGNGVSWGASAIGPLSTHSLDQTSVPGRSRENPGVHTQMGYNSTLCRFQPQNEPCRLVCTCNEVILLLVQHVTGWESLAAALQVDGVVRTRGEGEEVVAHAAEAQAQADGRHVLTNHCIGIHR